MPRDNDKNNGRPPRRGAGEGYKGGGKGRSGGGDRPARSAGPRGGDKKFGDKRPARAYGGKSEGFRKDGDRPRFNREDRPSRGPRKEFGAGDQGERRSFKPREDRGERSFGGRSRDDRAPRGEGSDARPSRGLRKDFGARDQGERRPFKPREDRGERSFGARSRDDRAPRGERSDSRPSRGPRKDFGAGDQGERRPFKPREDRAPRGDRGDSRPSRAGGFGDKKFGEKRPYTPRGEGRDARPARFDRADRPQRDDRPRFNRDDRGERGTRPPRRDFGQGEGRSNEKPWESRAPRRDDARRSDRPRDDRGSGDRPRFSRSRDDRPERDERKSFARPRFERDGEDRAPRGRSDWQEHPRSEGRDRGSREDRPRRDNEDDSRIFTKRPAFGGRGAYRERKPDFEKRAPRAAPKEKKTGDRIAKVIARAGVCSRRDAEEWITQGRVAVNGRVITSPALDVTTRDVITLDGKPLPERERTRLFLYHKPRGLMTTHDDPEGRPTVFDNLPEGLPRLISVGRLDFNTEGLLLLTNDGGLARSLELPDTGWLRRYRVRAHGEVTQAQLDELKKGVEVDGVKYGSIEATLERDQGSNVWIVFAIREGKNREVRNVMGHLGLEVNRLIRVSYGPFQLGEIEEGQVEEIRSRVLREQLGEKIVTSSGAHFDAPTHEGSGDEAQRAKAAAKPKREVVADRKGRRVLVQRTGSEEARARNEERAEGGPPRRPRGGYKGKRDIKPEADFTED